MSGPPGPLGPWVDPRPATVTVAGVVTVLLGIFGMLGTLAVGGLVVALGFLLDALAESKGGQAQDQVSGYAIALAVVVVAVGVLLGALHVLLGARVMRGGPVARIVLTLWDSLLALGGLAGLVLVVGVAASEEQGTSLTLVWLPLLSLVPPVVVLTCLWTPTSSAWFARQVRP